MRLRQIDRGALLETRALVAAVGEYFAKKWKQSKQGRQQQKTAVAVLNVGRMDDGVHQQAFRIDHDMSLLALDLLAGIVTVRINAGPPFSALFTLWLSMMQAVGLAAHSTFSRHRR